MNSKEFKKLAAIEYHGKAGITQVSLEAIARIIQFGSVINGAKLVSQTDTSHKRHGFILTVDEHEVIGIKCGFGSGYTGEGPSGLSKALAMLDYHGAEIVEYCVTKNFAERLDNACLTRDDLRSLGSENCVRKHHWTDYILADHEESRNRLVQKLFLPVIPFNIIDPRIMDLATEVAKNPEESIATGYKRLEEIVRKRVGSQDIGAKLFSTAFMSDKSKLRWEGFESGEQVGRANLFISIYTGYRNRRMHREFYSSPSELVREFLLINELFNLESAAVERIDS